MNTLSKLIASTAALIIALAFAWVGWHGIAVNPITINHQTDSMDLSLTIDHRGIVTLDHSGSIGRY